MSATLNLILNGNSRSFDDLGDQPAISRLVEALGFRADRVAIERNGEIVPRSEWATAHLADGDKLELVHFVGGGTA